MELPDVLSFDPNKVTAVNENGIVVIKKKTTKQEFLQLKTAERHLTEHPIVIGSARIRVTVPDYIHWDENRHILTTSFCQGSNMEELLKRCFNSARGQILAILREFIVSLRDNGFLWGDVAPRNTVISSSEKTLRVFDFERKLEVTTQPVSQDRFARFLRSYSYEELSCLLFEDEITQIFDGLLNEGEGMVCTSQIVSKRRKKLLVRLYGMKNYYSMTEVHTIEDLMSMVATPFVVDDSVFYPMQIIDRISSEGGPDVYTEIVYRLKDINQRSRYELLSQMA